MIKKMIILVMLLLSFIVISSAQQKVLSPDEIDKKIGEKYKFENKKKINSIYQRKSFTKADTVSSLLVFPTREGYGIQFFEEKSGKIKVHFEKITNKFKFKDIYINNYSDCKDIKYQLPDNILKELSSFELFRFCMAKPDYAYSAYSMKISSLKDFNGYVELLNRKDFPDILIKKLEFYDKKKKYNQVYRGIILFLGREDIYKKLNKYQKIKIYNSLLSRSSPFPSLLAARFITHDKKGIFYVQDRKLIRIFDSTIYHECPKGSAIKEIIFRKLEKLKSSA